MNKFFRIILAIWVVLWLVFLLREDKDGQYRDLKYFYTHSYDDNVGYLLGEKLYAFLESCRQNIPKGSTYELSGFEKFSIYEVRARYFLWPLRSVSADPDFKIVWDGGSGVVYPMRTGKK